MGFLELFVYQNFSKSLFPGKFKMKPILEARSE